MARTEADAFERYTHEVYGWAYRLLGRHHDALDVVQDVFVRWSEQCAQRPPRQARGWLRRVTLNRAIDLRRHRRTQVTSGCEADHVAAGQPLAGQLMDEETLRCDVADALAGLTEAQREVLTAKVYDGLTFAQIAAEFGFSVSTAKTHYLRAVQAVGDRLRPRWADLEKQP